MGETMDKDKGLLLIKDHIPKDILWSLNTTIWDIDRLLPILREEEDPAHNDAHKIDVLNIFQRMCDIRGINDQERYYGIRTIFLHDTGYKFVNLNKIDPNDHHYGSAYYAYLTGNPPEVIEGILYHNQDVLPKDIPVWIRDVRDADRIAATGIEGAVRLAIYFGFEHNETYKLDSYKKYQKKLLDKDPREARYYMYFLEEVLPFLIDNERLIEFTNNLRVILTWIDGDDHGLVEGVSLYAHKIFIRRIDQTRVLANAFDNFYPPYDEDDKRSMLELFETLMLDTLD